MTKILILLLFIGSLVLFLAGGYLLVQRYLPRSTKITTSASVPSQPVAIKIKSINVSLPVFKAKLKGNVWDMTDQGVSYLESTPLPGQKGNSVFYGHDFPALLGNLHNIKIGDTVQIEQSSGKTLDFKVTKIAVVAASDLDIIKNTSDRRLTIYTCTGFLDWQRLVVIAS